MTENNGVIAFPVSIAEGRARRHETSSSPIPTVIDFVSRRHEASVKAAGSAVEQSTPVLTPAEVWDALNDNRLVMHYQPQYEMRTGKLTAAEALVRLVDLNGQLIYPDRFIALVEQSDLIVPFGRAVIEQVCADLAACRAGGYPIQRIAINLSARQLNIDTHLLSFIDQMVTRYELNHADLEFELTERQSLTPQCEGLEVLTTLAHRGARIVIDDFGIGYSSIMYLVELPVSAFKLDRALVSRLDEDVAMQALIESLLVLADNLKLEVIAEGIETDLQYEYLVGAGCSHAQGFSYARPMTLGDFQVFMTEGKELLGRS